LQIAYSTGYTAGMLKWITMCANKLI
jgi:hypothetical protein